jgi:catechol 2,3-dioxygenase-like lactoylglutathione lyase family enzyme
VPVLNHHIVTTRQRDETALFFAEVLGLDAPVQLGEFAVLRVSADTTLDFLETDREIHQQHYAFLVTEVEFDEIFSRIEKRCLGYWADPFRQRPFEINDWDDGRGVYFDDPNGHLLEILTRPYGSGGTTARHPHPLVAPTIERRSRDGDA